MGRWIEFVPNGKIYWYLAGLWSTRKFWGYVHIRTESLSENRSFVGRMSPDGYQIVSTLIDAVALTARSADYTGVCDGAFGFGPRAEFTELIRFSGDTPSCERDEIFLSIVEAIQPFVRSAASIE